RATCEFCSRPLHDALPISCARHCLATSADEALAFARALGGPVVVKPPAGAGAKGTFRIDALTDLQRWLRGAPPTPAAPVLVEELDRKSTRLNSSHVRTSYA